MQLCALYYLSFLSLGQFTKVRPKMKYTPDWTSLDSRPLPAWYDNSKVGIFIHWGVYSVPSFGSEWFWHFWKGYKRLEYVQFMKDNYKPDFSYTEFASQFTAEFYDPEYWAELFAKSGAKYVVLTSKHHDGYTLWPSKRSWNWNSVDVGPHKDLVGTLRGAVLKTGLRFGLYHSLLEWYNPMYLEEEANNYNTSFFVDNKVIPEMRELVHKYEPDVFWSDGDGEALDTYWKSKDFLAWLYNDSPVKDKVVTNDRWGKGLGCIHGGFLTCGDRYSPGVLQTRKWENAMTLDRTSWGYNRLSKLSNYFKIEELIQNLVSTVSLGGNILVNVGPTHDGRIAPIMEERLLQMGEWLSINGESVYETKPWKFQTDALSGNAWYTESKTNKSNIYCTFLSWPTTGVISLGSIFDETIHRISLIDKDKLAQLQWSRTTEKNIQVNLPFATTVKWAWVLKIELTKLSRSTEKQRSVASGCSSWFRSPTKWDLSLF